MDPLESGIDSGAAVASQSEPPEGTSDPQAGTSAVEPSQTGTESSYNDSQDQTPGYADPELEKLANGLLPHLSGPITSPVVVEKLRRDIQSIVGRYNASRERVKAVEADLQSRAKSYSELAQTPGMKELMYGWANRNLEMFQTGLSILANSMGLNGGVSPAAPGAHPGNGTPAGVDPNADWTKLKPDQMGNWVDARIQQALGRALDEKLRQHVGPLYDTLGKYQRDQQFGSLMKDNPDLERYRPAAEAMLAQIPGLTEQQAYVLAKEKAGGFRQPVARPAGLVSEGAGQPSPLEEMDPDEAISQMIFAARDRNRRP